MRYSDGVMAVMHNYINYRGDGPMPFPVWIHARQNMHFFQRETWQTNAKSLCKVQTNRGRDAREDLSQTMAWVRGKGWEGAAEIAAKLFSTEKTGAPPICDYCKCA